ncbi:hypothetical protein CN138_33710 [Sinorhizobium meliloti]|nr:hypothetical protein CN215_33820 [Sinorhizobium meliloti]RVK04468.1 hypothetical protein CN164_32515 [Sinorhizobium meliloti]RVK44915.1 hypothetical protein CN162_32225 [Sinorhizobium meliloti]RVL43372.1 hypothetical protein CN145_32425 [Sinorhizobium meliloti]RVL61948.1 hypothetical protein CN138_33710 [Sinorhizobium meliloti]
MTSSNFKMEVLSGPERRRRWSRWISPILSDRTRNAPAWRLETATPISPGRNCCRRGSLAARLCQRTHS